MLISKIKPQFDILTHRRFLCRTRFRNTHSDTCTAPAGYAHHPQKQAARRRYLPAAPVHISPHDFTESGCAVSGKRHYLRQVGYAQKQPHRGPVLSPYSMRNSDFGCAANQDTDKRTSHRLCVLQVWRAFDFRQPRRVLGRKSRLPHARLPYADYSDREFFPHTACLSAEDIRIKSAGLPPPFVTKNHEDKQHVIPLPKKIDAYRLVFRY